MGFRPFITKRCPSCGAALPHDPQPPPVDTIRPELRVRTELVKDGKRHWIDHRGPRVATLSQEKNPGWYQILDLADLEALGFQVALKVVKKRA